MTSFLYALCLVLLFEGLLPLISPQTWRETFKRLVILKDGQLRYMGLTSVISGAILFWILK